MVIAVIKSHQCFSFFKINSPKNDAHKAGEGSKNPQEFQI